ncbi:MAG: DUF5916 domain-containing protein [Bacteroidales bacterium]
MPHRIPLLFLFFILTAGIRLSAQPVVQAVKFDTPPRLDGLVEEEVWKTAEPVTGFIQREPDTGVPFSQRTEVYFGYDELNLYVAFRCFCDPSLITAKEMARDVSLGNDDRVQVILDTYLDGRNAYWFQVGPRGSIGDAIVSENGAAFNKAWDGLWTGKAQIHSEGWDAEMAIPFKTMGFDPSKQTWGLKLIRYFKRQEETGYWPVANLNTHRFQVSDAGRLTGLQGISQGVGLDLVPYGLTGADYTDGEGKTKPVINAGFEAYYHITSNVKAAVTVNTDFAQTEVDDQQINFTRFNLFYPEKRDFFLDGANYFNFGINGDDNNSWNTRLIPYFSRRIGLDSVGRPIPVLYGGKITGQAGPWNIGTMYMKDQRKDWRNSHFVVGRFTRNLRGQSQVGIITTYGNSLQDVSNLLVGTDLRLATSEFLGDRNVSFNLYGLRSFTDFGENEPEKSNRQMAYGAEIAYPNDLIYFRLGHMQIQENFVAGIGFVPRPGVRQSYGELMIGPRPSRWGILQVQTGTDLDHISDFNGKLLTREWTVTPLLLRFLSGDQFTYKLTSSYEYLEDPFEIYQDYVIPTGAYSFLWHSLSFYTAQRRAVWALLDLRLGEFYNGSRTEIKVKAGYKVAVPLFVGGEVIRNDINLAEEGFVAHIYRVNLNILFSPDITLYNFVQYDSQSNRMGWQSRFQWILQPGREIFLVWNSIASDPYDRFQMEEASARLKVKFTIRF